MPLSTCRAITSLCIIILLLGVSSSFGENVNGEVTGEWTAENSPYIVTGHLSVPDGEELIIAPGVEVLFRANYRFNVFGRLEAIGTEADSILFGPEEGVGTGWGGFRFLDADSVTHLKYCLLRKGRAQGNDQVPDSLKSGANAFIYQGYVIIENSRIFDGIANYAGGGIAIWNGSPIIRNCLIETNFSYIWGGGVAIMNGSNPTIENCTVFSNSAGWNDASGFGGGMYIGSESSPTVTNSFILDNVAQGGENSGNGGGVHISTGSSPMFSYVEFRGNSAYAGGGIYTNGERTDPTFEWCNFIQNVANNGSRVGGAIYIRASSGITTKYCRFEENGSDAGGAIYIKEPHRAKINHCLFLRNGATRGGGAICTSNDLGEEPLRINNCTFIDNRATGLNDLGPGTVWARGWGERNSLIRMSSCIVVGASPQIGDGERLTAVYSHIQGGFEGEGNVDEDPCFYGNDTTLYLLTGNSPCVDSGEQELGGDPDETVTDRGWLHFPQNIWDDVDDSLYFEIRNTDRETVTVSFENISTVPIYATPVDWWEFSPQWHDDEEYWDVSSTIGDYDIYGIAVTGQQEPLWHLCGGNGEETPQIYSNDGQGDAWSQFDQPGDPSGDGFFDLASDGNEFLYGGDENRIIEFTTDGEFGLDYEGPDGFNSYKALGTDFWNAHGFVDYYIGDENGILVRADDEMWERQRWDLGAPIIAIAVKQNIRELYIVTEPDSGQYELSLFSPDDSTLIPLYDIHPPAGHTMGGIEIWTSEWDNGRAGYLYGIWQGDESAEGPDRADKIYQLRLYTPWFIVHPEPKLLMPGETAEWDVILAGDEFPTDKFGENEYLTANSYFQMAVNGYGDTTHIYVELEVEENSVNDDPAYVPTTSQLTDTYPNPFNSNMRFNYHLATASEYKVTLTDLTGREVKIIHSGIGRAGNHIGWINGDQLPSGSYMLKLWTPDKVDVRKVILVK